jgi:hypothetical protein
MPFDPVAYAKTDLAPFLTAICRLVEDEHPEQLRYFSSLLRSIESVSTPVDLADPLMQLSMSAFLGFDYSPSVALLLDQLLGQAQELTEVLSLDETDLN